MIWLDRYERKARLIPGLFAVAPIAIAVGSLGLREQPALALLGSSFGLAGFPILLTSIVRSRGLKVQERLIAQWGALHTTIYLRHRGQPNHRRQRERWRTAVEITVGQKLPTATEEAEDQVDADSRYVAAVGDLKELTRDREHFPLVFEENCNYGFERNLLGVRPLGTVISSGTLLLTAGALLLAARTSLEIPLLDTAIGGAACLGILLMWVFVPSDDRVQQIGGRYAERLLESASQFTNRSTQ